MPEKEDIAAGASGMPFTPEDRNEAEEAGETVKVAKVKRGRPPKKKAETPDTAALERRLADLEAKLAATQAAHTCHMCHKPGATIQRGNTGEWFHGQCMTDYRNGEDPLPQDAE